MESLPHRPRKALGTTNLPQKLGGKGQSLYSFHQPLRNYLLVLTLYTLAAYSTTAWALSGQALSGQRRVLHTGSCPVNQFYGGLVLSGILAPAAIFLRQMASNIASLHPFALAAQRAIEIGDLDRIMDPGPYAIRTLLRYSKWYAAVQAILMTSGTLLVPVGTLILTVDNFAPQNTRQAVVGVPAIRGKPIPLSTAMGGTIGKDIDRYGPNDPFLPILTSLVKGNTISQTALIRMTPGRLGPIATLNITFEPDVRYNGLVTYDWDGNCERADDEITLDFNTTDSSLVFTFPDGTQNSTSTFLASTFLWSNATQWTKSQIPLNGYTYVVQVGPQSFVRPPIGGDGVDYSNPSESEGLLLKYGAWITRVKCMPSFTWAVSSCLWTGSMMDECISTPGQNTTELDTVGLNALSGYMTAVLWSIYNRREPLFIHPFEVFAYRVRDINRGYGITALSISQLTTAGYYGSATVPTIGQSPYPVYIVRMPVLVTVALLLTLSVALVTCDMTLTWIRNLPIRKTSFLTIATAVRGAWWDRELHGRCTLGREMLRYRTRNKVKFGVDTRNTQHVGLAPVVHPIQKDDVYYGTMSREGGRIRRRIQRHRLRIPHRLSRNIGQSLQ